MIGVALIWFGLLYVLTFALGRAAFGITFAGASIYRIDTLFIVVGIYLALIGSGPRADGIEGVPSDRRAALGRQLDRIAVVAVTGVICIQVVSGLVTGLVGAQAHRTAMLQTENVIFDIDHAPDNMVYGIY